MSQPLLNFFQTDTVGVKKAGTAMAEIVEMDFFQSVVFQYNLEMLGDEVWFDKFAHCIYIDIIQIFFAVGCTAYLLNAATIISWYCSNSCEESSYSCLS